MGETSGEAERLRKENERLLIALWQIRMEAERATIDEPSWALPNRIIHLALVALGRDKQRAQDLAGANSKNQ